MVKYLEKKYLLCRPTCWFLISQCLWSKNCPKIVRKFKDYILITNFFGRTFIIWNHRGRDFSLRNDDKFSAGILVMQIKLCFWRFELTVIEGSKVGSSSDKRTFSILGSDNIYCIEWDWTKHWIYDKEPSNPWWYEEKPILSEVNLDKNFKSVPYYEN